MFGLQTLDMAIGVIFVFLLVSILAAAIREGLEALLKTRGAYLWLGIRELLDDRSGEGLAATFYRHPLIHSLFPGEFDSTKGTDRPGLVSSGHGMPSYIPSRNFAVALMDIAARGPITSATTAGATAPTLSVQNIRENIANIDNPAVQRVLLSAVDAAQGDLNRAQANIEAWYNSAMDRVSGWYKRTTQWWLLAIGALVAVGLNVNTLTIAHYLYATPAVRSAVVKRAESAVADPRFLDQATYAAAKQELQGLSLPIGWTGYEVLADADLRRPNGFWHFVLMPVVGWMATAFAATLGAPFWFDLLNKIMVIRSTVKPHEKSPEEASEDRQAKKSGTPNVTVTTAGAPSAAAPPPPPPPASGPTPAELARDIEADVDACDVAVADPTPDEELPPAQGGVQ